MLTEPPHYPRMPYLRAPEDEPGASVVPPDEQAGWFDRPVVVEEKLDGANVALWLDPHGRPQVAGRGGLGAMDRAGQLGRLRAWAAERVDALRILLEGGLAAYGEWLWVQHTVPYNRLPDWLVVLDLWSSGGGWCPTQQRNQRAAAAELAVPPLLLDGALDGWPDLERLFGVSAFGSTRAEGLVLRQGEALRCKVLAPAFRRADDAAWQGNRRHNRLAAREAGARHG